MAQKKPELRRNPPRASRPARNDSSNVPPPARQPGPPGTFPFLDLPPEVRFCIYDFFNGEAIKYAQRQYTRMSREYMRLQTTQDSLLVVSKEVRKEFLSFRWKHSDLPVNDENGRYFSLATADPNAPLEFEEEFLSFARDDTIRNVRHLRYRLQRRHRTSHYHEAFDYPRMRELASVLHRWLDRFESLQEVVLYLEDFRDPVPWHQLPARGTEPWKRALWSRGAVKPVEWEVTRRRFQSRSPRLTLFRDWQAVRQVYVKDGTNSRTNIIRVALLFRKDWQVVPPATVAGQNHLEVFEGATYTWR